MPQKRLYVDGAIYFATTRVFNHQKLFSQKRYCYLFLEVLDFCRKKLKFELFAFAVMPDHVHLLIRPNEINTISDTIRHIKGRFAGLVKATEDKFLGCGEGEGEEFILAEEAGEEFILVAGMPIWQKSFYDRIIRSDRQLFNTLEYIDHNAVKHQLTDHPFKYPFTSIHNHYQTGKEIITIDYLD